jgi:hypothetical protein
MYKINFIEATGMGPHQAELAEWAENHLYEIGAFDCEYLTTVDVIGMDDLLAKACEACGWDEIPSTGGLIVVWSETSE